MARWKIFGGHDVDVVPIKGGAYMPAKDSDYRALLVELWQLNRPCIPAGVVPGHNRPDQYDFDVPTHFRATCGCCGYRIRGGCFVPNREFAEVDHNDGDA